MKTKWVEDTLKYLTPHLNWEDASVYENNAFSTIYTIMDTLGNTTHYTVYFRRV